jgi:hypothetical protein
VSVEKTGSRTGLPYKVRWKHAGVHHARRFATAGAAAKFDRRIKDLKAAGELHLLDEEPRGTITLHDYIYEVWWPDYAEVNLTDEGRANYSVQLDLRIIPHWGDHPLRQLRPGPIEAWVATLRKQGVGDPTILKTLTVFRSILKRAERDEEIERNPIPLVAKPKQARTREPRAVSPYYVELIRRHMLDPILRRDKRGRRHARRPELDRHRDATLVSVLAYSGPSPRRCRCSGGKSGSAPSPTALRRAAASSRVRLGYSRHSPATWPSSVSAAGASMTTTSCSGSGRATTGTTGGSGFSNRRRSPSDCPKTRSLVTCAAASRACSSSRAATCSRSRPSLATSQARAWTSTGACSRSLTPLVVARPSKYPGGKEARPRSVTHWVPSSLRWRHSSQTRYGQRWLVAADSVRALCRTRTGDPFLTMEVLYQLS